MTGEPCPPRGLRGLRVRRPLRLVCAAATVAVASGVVMPVPAYARQGKNPTGSVFAWQADADGSWTDPAAWRLVSGPLGAGYPDGATDTAQFDTSGTAARTVTVPSRTSVTVGSIEFASPQPYTIAAADGASGLEIAGQVTSTAEPVTDTFAVPVTLTSPLTVSVADPATVAFTAPIGQRTGRASVTETGDGTLRLAAPGSFTGGVSLAGGTLSVADDAALGSGTLTLSAGTTLRAENGPRTLAVPVDIEGDNGQPITVDGDDLTFTSTSGSVGKPSLLDVDDHLTFARLLDGKNGQRGLRVGGSGMLTLGTAGPHNVGYASGSVTAESGAGLTLAGTGTVGAPTWLGTAHGRLSIGGDGAPGKLTATGDVALAGGTTFAVDLDRTAPGSGYDQLTATPGGPAAGDVDLGGATLAATVGAAVSPGDSFTIVQAAGAVSGRFAGLAGSGCTLDSGGAHLQVDYQPQAVVVTSVPQRDDVAVGMRGYPSPVAAGAAGSFTVTVTDCDGAPLPSYRGTVRFTSSDGRATLPTPYRFTAADAGQHTFSATLRTPGTQSLTATDSASGSYASQTGIVVAPPRADLALRVATSRGTAVVGDTVSATITATDLGPSAADGVTVALGATAGLTVTAATAGAGSYDTATGTWTLGTVAPGDKGVLQVTCTVTAAGSQSLTATKTGQTEPDPSPANDTATAVLTVTPTPTVTPTSPAPTKPAPTTPAPTTTSPAPTTTTPPPTPTTTAPAPTTTPPAPTTPAATTPVPTSATPTPAGTTSTTAAVVSTSAAPVPSAASTPPPTTGPTTEPTTGPGTGPGTGNGSDRSAPPPGPGAGGGVTPPTAGGSNGPAGPAGSSYPGATRPPSGRTEVDALSITRKAVEVASVVARGAAFPGLLLLLLVLFVVVQNEIDRRDPKLAQSPLVAEPDLDYE